MEQILKLAKKIGADGAEFATKWNGFNVYTPTYKGDETPIIGNPQFILVSGETIKLALTDEAFEILDYLIKTEEANK